MSTQASITKNLLLLFTVLPTALFWNAAAWAETTPAKGSVDTRITSRCLRQRRGL